MYIMLQSSLNWHSDYPQQLAFRLPEKVDSLTKELSSISASFSVSLQFLGEITDYPLFDDILLNHNEKTFRQPMFTRKVVLYLNKTPVVHAQSICLPDSAWCEHLNCGSTPLGALLFSGSLELMRSSFEFAVPDGYLVARRSWFEWQGQRLYLVECFLESILQFVESEQDVSQLPES